MAVSINASATAKVAAGGVITLDLTTLTIAAGSNIVLEVWTMFGVSATLPTSVTAVWDFGGSAQSMTSIGSRDTTDQRVQLWGLVNPATGNKTLRVSWTNTADVTLFAKAFNGASQAGGATTFPNFTSAQLTGANASLAISSAVGDWTVCGMVDVGANISSATQTSDFIDTSLSFLNSAGQNAAGAASVTHAWTNASDVYAIAGNSIAAAAAGQVTHNTTSHPLGLRLGTRRRMGGSV